MSPFLLSHHAPHEWNRTYALGGVRLCARCLGTYSALAMGLFAQFRHHSPLAWHGDVFAVLLLTLPALVDWSLGQLRPSGGANWVRTLTGAGLGCALSRSLYIHLHRAFPPVLLLQALLVTGVALPVILFALHRRRRSDR